VRAIGLGRINFDRVAALEYGLRDQWRDRSVRGSLWHERLFRRPVESNLGMKKRSSSRF
jgi:hypothetical protein